MIQKNTPCSLARLVIQGVKSYLSFAFLHGRKVFIYIISSTLDSQYATPDGLNHEQLKQAQTGHLGQSTEIL